MLESLPPGTRVVVLADRGFVRATFLECLRAQGVDFVVRIDRGTMITDREGRRFRWGRKGYNLENGWRTALVAAGVLWPASWSVSRLGPGRP